MHEALGWILSITKIKTQERRKEKGRQKEKREEGREEGKEKKRREDGDGGERSTQVHTAPTSSLIPLHNLLTPSSHLLVFYKHKESNAYSFFPSVSYIEGITLHALDFLIFFFFWETMSLRNSGWPWPHGCPTLASQRLGLQAWATTRGFASTLNVKYILW